MKYALVGNNDGPLRLFKALKKTNSVLPVFVGLQKKPEAELLSQYQEALSLIPFYTGFKESTLLKLLDTQKPEVLINCFCNFRFTELLERYTCYNIHPGYLPYYRGRHPMHWALIKGEKNHGITLHKMTEELDEGAIVWQAEVPIHQDQSVAELRESLMQKLENAFPGVLETIIENNYEFIPKSSQTGSYDPPRVPEDSELNIWNDFPRMYRMVKALRKEPYQAYLSFGETGKLPVCDAKLEKLPQNIEFSAKPEIVEQTDTKIILKSPEGYFLHLYFNPSQKPGKIKIDFIV